MAGLGASKLIDFLRTEGEGKQFIHSPARSVIFEQGQHADAVYYICSGAVTLRVNSRQGREAVVALLKSGDFFGEGCLTTQTARPCTAVGLIEGTLLRIDKSRMAGAIHREPDVAQLFVSHLLSRNQRIEEDLVDQLFNSSEKRLARVLLLLAGFSEKGRERVIDRISQETLAGIVGTTRSRISFFMNKFRRLGLIKYNGRLEVHDSLASVILRD
jgi:CRP/FNR family transcriptional regulator, cyclic AMP receptor protein